MGKRKINPRKSIFAARLRADEARHLMNTYKRPPIVFTRGRGCRLYDSEGREYLDFLAGIAVNALGHAHPRLMRVIRREAGRAIPLSNLFHNAYQGPLARKLADWSGLDRVFFTNSGTEAIEGALKLARAYAHAKRKSGAMTANVNRATSKVDTEDRFIGMMASALDDGGYPGMIVHYKRLAVCLPPGRKFILLIGSLLRDARPPQPRDPGGKPEGIRPHTYTAAGAGL